MKKAVRGFAAIHPGGGKATKYVRVTTGDELKVTYYPTDGNGDEPVEVCLRRIDDGPERGRIAVKVDVHRGVTQTLYEAWIDQPEKVKER